MHNYMQNYLDAQPEKPQPKTMNTKESNDVDDKAYSGVPFSESQSKDPSQAMAPHQRPKSEQKQPKKECFKNNQITVDLRLILNQDQAQSS